MNIAFDATAILGPKSKNRGIGNYAYSQFKNMIEMDQKNHYYFFNMMEPFSMEEKVVTKNVKDFYLFTGRDYDLIANKEYEKVYGDIVQRFICENKIDVFYITSPFEQQIITYKKEWFAGVKTVATVYDIIPYVMKGKYLKDKVAYKKYMNQVEMLRWVDEYLVISKSVKDDMVSYLEFPAEKIHVIYGASDPDVFKKLDLSPKEVQDIRNKFGIKDRFLMCTGGDDERKNLSGLIKAYSKVRKELREQYQLVIVCKLSQESVQRYMGLVTELGLKSRVVLTNFVTTEELVKLYNMATLTVFPSLYEGFGLPILESWLCGTPVLTSSNSSLKEIGGEAAVLVNADSVTAIAKGLENALLNMDLKELADKGEQRQKVFTWEKVAKDAIQVIENIKVSVRTQDEKKVKRIAMFTPLPPIESGISDYSVDILSQLVGYFEIDVYIDDYKTDFKMDGVEVYPFKYFAKNLKKYDRIIYQVGNSLFHEYMFSFIKKYPGIVVLHDYNLRNVLEASCLYKKQEIDAFEKNVREDYDEEITKEYLEHLNTAYAQRFEINGFVVNYAERIIVHSLYAKKKLLEREISRDIDVIPHYCVIEKKADYKGARVKLGVAEEELIFAAFGHIHETKRILPALAAFGEIYRKVPDAKFYLVGKMANELQERFEEVVNRYGIRENVIVTGYVTLEEFEQYMDAADICLNLRYPYNGESSGSFMRLLGKGKCTIINRIGSFAEVPEEACIMIDSVEDMTEQKEISQIYDAMLYALVEENRYKIGKCARNYAQDVLDLKKVSEEYVKAIRKPFKKRKGLDDSVLKMFSEKRLKGVMYEKEELEELAKTLAYSLED